MWCIFTGAVNVSYTFGVAISASQVSGGLSVSGLQLVVGSCCQKLFHALQLSPHSTGV